MYEKDSNRYKQVTRWLAMFVGALELPFRQGQVKIMYQPRYGKVNNIIEDFKTLHDES